MQHPDEGTIHAWIDGALDADSARELEAHVATCAECARVVAEARGLVAASSRILTALDNVPGDVIPGARPAKPQQVRRFQMTPFWMRTAAAVLIVAGSSALFFTGKLNKPELKRADIAMSSEADLGQVQAQAEMPPAAPAPAAPGARDLAANSTPATSGAGTGGGAQPLSARGQAASSSRRQAAASVPTVGTADAARDAKLSDAAEERVAASVRESEEKKAESDGRLTRVESRPAVARADSAPQVVGNAAGVLSGVQTSAGAGKSSISRDLEGSRIAAPTVARSAAPSAAQGATAPSVSPEAAFQRNGANGWRMRAATGCYELSLSPWTGGSIPFGAPPVRIELDSLTSVQESIRGLNLVHPARGAAGNGAPLAYWRVLGDSAYVTWRDDQRGVVLRLPIGGEVLSGSARTFSVPSGAEPVQSSVVEARRIACR